MGKGPFACAAVLAPFLLMADAQRWAESDNGIAMPDPFVMCEDGVYYAYGTGSHDGIPVMTSTNLVEWQDVGRLALHKADSYGEKHFWAPEVYKTGKEYAMCYAADERLCMAFSESPLGPFRQNEKKPLFDYWAIDGNVIRDGGKTWLFYVRLNPVEEIFVAEMENDLTSVKPGTERRILGATEPWELANPDCSITEGPFVVKIGDTFVLTYSANDYKDKDYAVGVAAAKNILGPWTKHRGSPIMRRTHGLVGTGHHAFFKDFEGKWRIAFHSHNSSTNIHPRLMHIAEVEWIPVEGVPVPSVGKLLPVARIPDMANPAVNSRKRMPAVTYAMPLASEKAALSDALEFDTPWKTSLDGEWKFRWTGDPSQRPIRFWDGDYDVSGWETIDVPSCVELRGYGMPHYLAHGYPHKFAWPKILDRETGRPDYNPVLSYRRKFAVPDGWRGRETILRFEGVSSAFYVWINGSEVGYAEDSKLPSEFNITEFLKDGENDIAVQVFRWCDGSYVEDQDMMRFSGIFRDVALWSRPKSGIVDFAVSQTFDEDYANARMEVAVSTYGGASRVSARLYDAERRLVGEAVGGGNAALSIAVPRVSLWSAEKPYLYTLVLKCGEDIRAKRIGFKEQKIVGEVFYVNGKPVKFKGVNRHETSPENGRSVTLDEMVRDITLMKRYNIDTVRTSHYPNHRLWYDLCDRYGIYLVAEANVEAHGAGYGKDGFGPIKEWEHTIVERNERQILFYRNSPSVTIWSVGNETKHGDCFRAAIAAVRKIDPSRPIHWERGAEDADMDAAMYLSVERVGEFGAAHDAAHDKPFFHTEYAHAMGNAIGNFQEYWDVIYAHPSLIGGCIWDWKDQAIWAGTGRIDPKTGREERYFAYGGDFYDNPHNGPICQNGIVGPLAEVSPKLVEVGHVHRNLVVERGTGFVLWNRFAFTYADEFDGSWRLLDDGAEVASGRIAMPHIAPLSRGEVALEGLDAALAKDAGGKERFVNVSFATKADAPWAKKGWVVARDQIALGVGKFNTEAQRHRDGVGNGSVGVKENDRSITVERGGTVAVFSRKSGLLTRLSVKGVAVLEEVSPGVPAGPHLTCVRAFVDNDKWLKESFLASGLVRLGYHPEPIVVEGDTVKTVIDVTGTKGCGFKHECEYRFGPDGSVSIFSKVVPYGTMPKALPRLGLTMRLDPALEHLKYYGRGPWENYIDRCTGSFVGIYESTVAEQYVDYVRPQDNGYKSGVRWAEFTDGSGKGVRFTASEPMFMQALHFGWEDIFLSRHDGWQKDRLQIRRYAPPVAQSDVILNLDIRQTGLGGASIGPEPMGKYRFDPCVPVSWTIKIDGTGRNTCTDIR